MDIFKSFENININPINMLEIMEGVYKEDKDEVFDFTNVFSFFKFSKFFTRHKIGFNSSKTNFINQFWDVFRIEKRSLIYKKLKNFYKKRLNSSIIKFKNFYLKKKFRFFFKKTSSNAKLYLRVFNNKIRFSTTKLQKGSSFKRILNLLHTTIDFKKKYLPYEIFSYKRLNYSMNVPFYLSSINTKFFYDTDIQQEDSLLPTGYANIVSLPNPYLVGNPNRFWGKRAYFNFMFFYDFCRFRHETFNLIFRFNYNIKEYFSIKSEIWDVFNSAGFPYGYLDSLVDYFSYMCYTRETVRFSNFVKRLIEKLGRVAQKNFFYTFTGIPVDFFLSVLRRHGILGFYLRVSGKIGGYVGDRTKLFLVRYGKCSRSQRIYKYSYSQNISFTKPGSIGINSLLVFK